MIDSYRKLPIQSVIEQRTQKPAKNVKMKTIKSSSFLHCVLIPIMIGVQVLSQQTVKPGTWQLVIPNGGVSAMHMTATMKNTVVMYDRSDYGASQLRLPNGFCRNDPNDFALKHDCWAHSIEYNIATNKFRPLTIMTDTWCSSGSFRSDGTLVSTGGFNDGHSAVRTFTPCTDSACDWIDTDKTGLRDPRWYASNQILPDNSIIVVGGRRSFSYEFFPGRGSFALPFLQQTNTPNAENNLYPFLHLSADGNLFIFANQDSILLNYKSNKIVRTYPRLPGGPRNYPSSGSSVMLPLSASDEFKKIEVMICGGAPTNGFQSANAGNFMDALNTCGRMVITDGAPKWAIETMPAPRVMSDMLILPNGEVLVINGAHKGTAGWEMGRNPALAPFLYRPTYAVGNRFVTVASTTIPRLYHSSAIVLPDGRVLIGGSNPHVGYVFTGVEFPTELRLEAYSPYYLDGSYADFKPAVIYISTSSVLYGGTVTVTFKVGTLDTKWFRMHLYAPSFTTHSFSMNQRMLVLSATMPRNVGAGSYVSVVRAPPNSIVAPAGYYMLIIVNAGIPSVAQWVHVG